MLSWEPAIKLTHLLWTIFKVSATLSKDLFLDSKIRLNGLTFFSANIFMHVYLDNGRKKVYQFKKIKGSQKKTTH